MIQFVKNGDRESYVCAAGILAHYVGDSCQPLHGTIHFNEAGSHSPFEGAMLMRHRGDVPDQVKKALNNRTGAADIANGAAAAQATVDLMNQVQGILPWETIVDSFVAAGKPSKPTDPDLDDMWGDLRDKVGVCMAEGTLFLANLWQSAWKLGGGDAKITKTDEIPHETLRKIYEKPDFLPSLALEEYPY